MKKIKKEVDITEDNYKGYVELYKYKDAPFSDNFNISLIKEGIKMLGLTFLTTSLSASAGLLDNGLLFILGVLSMPVGCAFYMIKKMEIYENININDILNEYPNIENIDINNLRKSLENVGILKQINDEYELDIEGYETKLKCNKIIEETKNEQKYEYRDLTADYIVPEKEIEKVKQKIRKLNNR